MLIILGVGCALSSLLQMESLLMLPAALCFVSGAVYGIVAWRINARAAEQTALDLESSTPVLGLTPVEEEN